MSLSRDSILWVCDLPVEEVHVPEWNGSVFVRGLKASEREIFEKEVGEESTKVRATLVAMSACDESGNRLFEKCDVERIADKSAVAVDRIFKVAIRLSAISKTEVESLEKN